MNMACDEEAIIAIAVEVFGTTDYKAMLAILPPYDGMVRSFNKQLERLKVGKGGK